MHDDYDPELDFKAEVDRLLLAVRFLADVRVAAIRATIDAAHSIGPLLDPTAYRDALDRGDMDRIAALVSALEPALTVWRERFAEDLAATVAGAD